MRPPVGRHATLTAVLLAAAACSAGLSAAASMLPTPTAVTYNGSPSVGALFRSAHVAEHTCTATVLDSPTRNLLITAAHCIRGDARGYIFVPGYHDGKEPFGAWRVNAAFGPASWVNNRNPQADLAILEVAPHDPHGHLIDIQAVTGGHKLADSPTAGGTVTVPAYASGTDDKPFKCTARVYYHSGYPAFDCHSYPDGTSGAAWLLKTSQGQVIAGVIGGLHQGGCTAVTSYTSTFGNQALNTYSRAVHNQPANTFPPSDGDGC